MTTKDNDIFIRVRVPFAWHKAAIQAGYGPRLRALLLHYSLQPDFRDYIHNLYWSGTFDVPYELHKPYVSFNIPGSLMLRCMELAKGARITSRPDLVRLMVHTLMMHEEWAATLPDPAGHPARGRRRSVEPEDRKDKRLTAFITHAMFEQMSAIVHTTRRQVTVSEIARRCIIHCLGDQDLLVKLLPEVVAAQRMQEAPGTTQLQLPATEAIVESDALRGDVRSVPEAVQAGTFDETEAWSAGDPPTNADRMLGADNPSVQVTNPLMTIDVPEGE